MKKNSLPAIVGIAAALVSLPAAAQQSNDTYIGVRIGSAKYQDICAGATSCDDHAGTVSFFGGKRYSRYLSVEGAVHDSGNARVDDASVKARGADLDLLATFPLVGGFSLLGSGGLFYGILKGDTQQEKKFGFTFGGGLQYDLSDQVGLRAEWQRYPQMGGGGFGAKTDVDFFTLGALYRF